MVATTDWQLGHHVHLVDVEGLSDAQLALADESKAVFNRQLLLQLLRALRLELLLLDFDL